MTQKVADPIRADCCLYNLREQESASKVVFSVLHFREN